MPEIDGRELVRRLRADPTTAAIPLVLMTADAHDQTEIAAEVDAWLAKPFHLTTLFATLARWAPVG